MYKKLLLLLCLLPIGGCTVNGEKVIAFKGVSIWKVPHARENDPLLKRYGLMFNFELFPGPKVPPPHYDDPDMVLREQQQQEWLYSGGRHDN